MRWVCVRVLVGLLLCPTVGMAQSAANLRTGQAMYDGVGAIKAGRVTKHAFSNDIAAHMSIHSVSCYVDGSAVVVRPILHTRGSESVVQTPITCQPGVWTPGRLTGMPILHKFDRASATCPTEPCSVDLKIEAVSGEASNLIMKIVGCILNSRGQCR